MRVISLNHSNVYNEYETAIKNDNLIYIQKKGDEWLSNYIFQIYYLAIKHQAIKILQYIHKRDNTLNVDENTLQNRTNDDLVFIEHAMLIYHLDRKNCSDNNNIDFIKYYLNNFKIHNRFNDEGNLIVYVANKGYYDICELIRTKILCNESFYIHCYHNAKSILMYPLNEINKNIPEYLKLSLSTQLYLYRHWNVKYYHDKLDELLKFEKINRILIPFVFNQFNELYYKDHHLLKPFHPFNRIRLLKAFHEFHKN
jgi:hypothetical protein